LRFSYGMRVHHPPSRGPRFLAGRPADLGNGTTVIAVQRVAQYSLMEIARNCSGSFASMSLGRGFLVFTVRPRFTLADTAPSSFSTPRGCAAPRKGPQPLGKCGVAWGVGWGFHRVPCTPPPCWRKQPRACKQKALVLCIAVPSMLHRSLIRAIKMSALDTPSLARATTCTRSSYNFPSQAANSLRNGFTASFWHST
jgi:hypothetical protein